ncbi:tRNA pseudouridine(55) synthase TruB [Candidatus Wolbachia massiliensis]|uniref:tRNA pseudouridine synthase B n=1 Tax=Candidatus Wolbachia massiliensis TaxID=1845000 RepID=A0A7M3U384_9RICK|nr:tRNA pseudouridine(55) synthase TruB [Candidatus Wolbachia massiliensis]QOD38869.1 tRNA pseudouridine(55) synthase TruB [Candidatus Wolbachia massiliensis]
MHGWLNLDKPIGISSAQAVARVKKIFCIKKAGHLGTLDPLASGVLPIALGEATKTIPYLSCDLKAYNFTIKWGEQRTTDDLDGDIIRTSDIKPEYNQINCVIKNFVGKITQTPPQFSAVKIKGIRAYKLARSGQKVNIKPRPVQVHQLVLISVDTVNNSADFAMLCGSGVYVRSIARDLGIALDCFGHITKLRRTMVGNFRENESVTIEQLTKKRGDIIPIELALESMFKVRISAEEVGKIKKGQEIVLNNLRNLKNYDICCTMMGNVPIAICSFIYGCVKPIRVFNI